MSSVPIHRYHSWWSAALSHHSASPEYDFDDAKAVIDSLLRDLKVQGKLTPETVQ